MPFKKLRLIIIYNRDKIFDSHSKLCFSTVQRPVSKSTMSIQSAYGFNAFGMFAGAVPKCNVYCKNIGQSMHILWGILTMCKCGINQLIVILQLA